MRRSRKNKIKQCQHCFFNEICSTPMSNCNSFYPIDKAPKKYIPKNTETIQPVKKFKIDILIIIRILLIIIGLFILGYTFTS